MRTQKLVIAIAIILLATTLINAKKRINGNPSNIANRVITKMQKVVALTDSQQLKIKDLTVNYINQINNVEDNEISTISLKHKADVDSILTGLQKDQIKAKKLEKMNTLQHKN